MTRQHHTQFHCPNCKTWHTSETSFGRWIRNNRELESGLGFYVYDVDYVIHKFKTFENRGFQLMMEVEIKSNGAALRDEQADSLHIRNQLLRNRRQTPTKELKFQAVNYVSVKSLKSGKLVNVRHYGVHLLTFSGLGPDDSDWIKWDKRIITADDLTKVLSFELDPDTFRPIDLRNHHRTLARVNQSLPLGRVEAA